MIRCLENVAVDWCVVGAHAVGVYSEPRTTQAVDFLIDDRKMKPLLAALEREIGELGVVDIGAAVRLTAVSIDLIRASTNRLFREALARSQMVGGWRVPALEVLVVLKFLAATSRWRQPHHRSRDIADVLRLLADADETTIDRELMIRLAAEVYPGAEEEFADLLARIARGDPITI